MRKITKHPASPLLTDEFRYIEGDAENNRYIKDILLTEQGHICCYTEIYLGRAIKTEIDHFNPRLKRQDADGYYNWYAVSGQWNNEKSSKWDAYQPVLEPTAADLEDRITYDEGDYLVDPSDTEASNLYKLVKLDDPDLADERKKYIKRMQNNIAISGQTIDEYFESLLEQYPQGVHFIRALKEVFGYVHPNY